MNNRKRPTVYKPKRSRKAGFSASKSVLPTIVTIAAAGVICCFGYSIAKPILNGGDSAVTSGEISVNENDAAGGTIAPEDGAVTTTSKVTTSLVVVNGGDTGKTSSTTAKGDSDASGGASSNNSSTNGGGSGTEGTGSGSNTNTGSTGSSGSGSSTGGNSGTGSSTEGNSGGSSSTGNSSTGSTGSSSNGGGSSTSDVTAPEAVADVYPKVQCSVRLPESAVADEASLRAMLQNVKSKYPNAGAVVIPMKLSGGELNYSSKAAGNAAASVCKGSMTAAQIASIVREEGLYAYASCSLLDDHIYADTYRDASYMVEKNGVITGDRWLDNLPSKGGKTWLDPSSKTTVSYLQSIVKELSSSGFSAILCSGFTYPDFSQADEKFLNPDVYAKNPDAMIDLANSLEAASPDTTDIVLDLNAYYAMKGWELVYAPAELDVSYALLNTSSGDASAVSSWAQSNSGDMSVSISYTDGSGSGHCVINY